MYVRVASLRFAEWSCFGLDNFKSDDDPNNPAYFSSVNIGADGP